MAAREGSVETMDYAAMMRRMLAGWERRLVDADMEDVAELVTYQAEVHTALANVVDGLRARGVSWATIARATGTTRQGAQQRFTREGPTDG
jgi:hypothetical protein